MGGFGGNDLYMATRSDTAEPFGNVISLGPAANTDSNETNPSISVDGLSLYFDSNRPGGFGLYDIYVATRSNTSEPFANVVNVGPAINGTSTDTDDYLRIAIGYDFSGVDELGFHWAMTCANDTIEGGVKVPGSVPEPATMLLFGTGLAGLAAARKRKNQEKDDA